MNFFFFFDGESEVVNLIIAEVEFNLPNFLCTGGWEESCRSFPVSTTTVPTRPCGSAEAVRKREWEMFPNQEVTSQPPPEETRRVFPERRLSLWSRAEVHRRSLDFRLELQKGWAPPQDSRNIQKDLQGLWQRSWGDVKNTFMLPVARTAQTEPGVTIHTWKHLLQPRKFTAAICW